MVLQVIIAILSSFVVKKSKQNFPDPMACFVWTAYLILLFLMINQQQQPIFPDSNSRLPRTGQWTSRMFCCCFFCLWQVAITNVFYETSFICGNTSLVDNITINAHNSGTLQPPVLVREFVLVRSISY